MRDVFAVGIEICGASNREIPVPAVTTRAWNVVQPLKLLTLIYPIQSCYGQS